MSNARIASILGLSAAIVGGCAAPVTLNREAQLTDALGSIHSFEADIAVENTAALRALDALALSSKQQAQRERKEPPPRPTEAEQKAEREAAFRMLACSSRYSLADRLTGIVSDRAKRLDKYAKAPDAGLANIAGALRKELAAYKSNAPLTNMPLDAPGGKDEAMRASLCLKLVDADQAFATIGVAQEGVQFAGAGAVIGLASEFLKALETLVGFAEKQARAKVVEQAAKAYKADVVNAIGALAKCLEQGAVKPIDCDQKDKAMIKDTDGSTNLTVLEYPLARHRVFALQRARAAFDRAMEIPDGKSTADGGKAGLYEKQRIAARMAKHIGEWNALLDVEFSVADDHKAMQRSAKVLLDKLNAAIPKAFDALAQEGPMTSEEAIAAIGAAISDLKAFSDERNAYWKAWRGRLD